MSAAVIRMLRWMSDKWLKERVRTEWIHKKSSQIEVKWGGDSWNGLGICNEDH